MLSSSLDRHVSGAVLLMVVALSAAGAAVAGETDPRPLPAKVSFNQHVRPILSENCFACHGPDAKVREAKLRLDVRTSAVGPRKGGPAVVAGKSASSQMIQRILSKDPEERMPPPNSHKKLSARQKAMLQKWIDQGAIFEKHWSFIVPKKPVVPKVSNGKWVANPIDAFVLARLDAEKLKPLAPANRRALIRRVTFDLTGLPPNLANVEAFVADKTPNAYEKVVDRLLASPRYGEHMGRFWLDAARYGDTHGLHLDNYRETWPYRDWVVRAFNQNKPFDQFVTEQLAGDLIPNATISQKVATGFLRAHVTTSEGGSISEEVYVRNVIDRVETFGTVFMGLTIGCATCHDHKFDPLSQKEFYQMFAYFNNLEANPLDGNKKNHAPVLKVPDVGAQAQVAALNKEIAQIDKKLAVLEKSPGAGYATWLRKAQAQAGKKQPLPSGATHHYPLDEGKGKKIASSLAGKPGGNFNGKVRWTQGKAGGAVRFDGRSYVEFDKSANFSRTGKFSYGGWIKVDGRANGAIMAKMNEGAGYRGWDLWIQKRQIAMHFVSKWESDCIKVESTNTKILKPNTWHHVFVTYDGSSKAAGVKIYVDGKSTKLRAYKDNLRGPTESKVPLRFGGRSKSLLANCELDDARIYGRTLSGAEVGILSGADPISPILATVASKRSAQQKQTLVRHYLNNQHPAFKELSKRRSSLQAKAGSLGGSGGTTPIWKERAKPKDAFILIRGQYDQRGDKVARGLPSILPPMPPGASNDRLGLAKWLLSSTNPLMARVTVNRFWQQVFGVGLTKTSEDLGSQGEPPSHPELLDHLAVKFRTSGWDTKTLMKSIVTSSTYRQTSSAPQSLYGRDPENRLMARGPRFRLDAEMLRDNALSIGGLLVETMGGPSVKPPQPGGLWFAVGYSGSNTVRFKKDSGPDKVHRRSMYTFWKRTSPPPQMTTFDAPSRESCSVRRERTNTPLQALLLMNDPQYVEAARGFAQRIMTEGGKTPATRLTYGFRLATARPPSAAEAAVLTKLYQVHLAKYKSDTKSAAALVAIGEVKANASLNVSELAAWTMVANLILNLDEVLNKN
jgi:hypothetical protein